MEYDPRGGTVIEYGRPKYLSDRDGNVTEINNINENVNARFLYMSFKRTRFLPLGAPVTDETKSTTTVSLRGIECTLRQLFGNIVFITHAPTSFKCIIYERILSTYRDNIVEKICRWGSRLHISSNTTPFTREFAMLVHFLRVCFQRSVSLLRE